jgi:hypothetical protein
MVARLQACHVGQLQKVKKEKVYGPAGDPRRSTQAMVEDARRELIADD